MFFYLFIFSAHMTYTSKPTNHHRCLFSREIGNSKMNMRRIFEGKWRDLGFFWRRKHVALLFFDFRLSRIICSGFVHAIDMGLNRKFQNKDKREERSGAFGLPKLYFQTSLARLLPQSRMKKNEGTQNTIEDTLHYPHQEEEQWKPNKSVFRSVRSQGSNPSEIRIPQGQMRWIMYPTKSLIKRKGSGLQRTLKVRRTTCFSREDAIGRTKIDSFH